MLQVFMVLIQMTNTNIRQLQRIDIGNKKIDAGERLANTKSGMERKLGAEMKAETKELKAQMTAGTKESEAQIEGMKGEWTEMRKLLQNILHNQTNTK